MLEKFPAPAPELGKEQAQKPESPDMFAERFFDIKSKLRETLSGRVDERQLEELAEHEARVVTVADITTDYRKKKFRDVGSGIWYEKKVQLLDSVGLTMSDIEGDENGATYLAYGKERYPSGVSYLADPKRLDAHLKGEAGDICRTDAERFQAGFQAMPAGVQDAAREWLRWSEDLDGAGYTLDRALASGAIKKEAYDEVLRGRSEGKKILWSGSKKQYQALMYRQNARFYWALVDDRDALKRFTETVLGIDRGPGFQGELAERAARGVMPMLERTTSRPELDAVLRSVLSKIDMRTRNPRLHDEFLLNVMRNKWFPNDKQT